MGGVADAEIRGGGEEGKRKKGRGRTGGEEGKGKKGRGEREED